MSFLGLDLRKRGTHYQDRLDRIQGAFQREGIFSHTETDRKGEKYEVIDIRPYVDNSGKKVVVLTRRNEKYGFHANSKHLDTIQRMSKALAYTMNVDADKTSVEIDGDCVWVCVKREDQPPPLRWDEAWKLEPHLNPGEVMLGLTENEEQFVIDMSEPNKCHVAIIGQPGSGKTNVAKTIVYSAFLSGTRVALFDHSGEFEDFAGHPLVFRGGVFKDLDDIVTGLGVLSSRAKENDGKMFIVVDDVPTLVRKRPILKEFLGILVDEGRSGGKMAVLISQHALVDYLGKGTLASIPLRILGKVAGPTQSWAAAGARDIYAEKLQGVGDMLAWDGHNRVHFESPYMRDIAQALRNQYPPKPVWKAPTQHKVQKPKEDKERGFVGHPYNDIPKAVIEYAKARYEQYLKEQDQRLAEGKPPRKRFHPSLNDIEAYYYKHYKNPDGTPTIVSRPIQHRARYYALGELSPDPLDRKYAEEREQAYEQSS